MTVPLCKDCKHVRKGLFRPERHWQCAAPRNGASPVTGKPIFRFADLNRGIWGCMQEGKYFEAKP